MLPSSLSKRRTGDRTCKQGSSKLKLSGTSEKKTNLLKERKFYLDVKNHLALKKIEERLKAHGAALELFLTQEVQFVLTDRQEWNSGFKKHSVVSLSPSPSSSWISPSTVRTDSPDDGLTSNKSKSRVEAMLERARLQPQRVCAADPLQFALTWKIPIYSVDVFFRWLDRKTDSLKHSLKHDKKSNGVRVLKGLYLKVEPAGKFCRPQFKEFDEWPSISVESDLELPSSDKNCETKKLKSAKCSQNDGKPREHRMTRQKVAKEETAVAGYCEICSQRYCDLTDHIASVSHIKHTKEKADFAALDKLINKQSVESLLCDIPSLSVSTASSCRRALRSGIKDLHSPCSLPPLSPSMGSKQSQPSLPSPILTNGYHATRSTSRLLSTNDNCKEPLQVQCNGIEHCDEGAKSDSALVGGGRGTLSLRSMRSVSASYPGSTKDLSCRSRSQRNHWGLLSTAENQSISSRSEQKSKLSKKEQAKPKRLSGEEKLLEDNKSYYKVEVLHTKLRSAGSVANESDDGQEREKDGLSSADGKEPVVVRFHKVRKSELHLLSNEAENFMFGEKPSPSETSSDGENESGHHENGDFKNNLAQDIGNKSKRRTHAEAFIHDNFDYYKFEIPSSRLRLNNHPSLCKDEIKKEYNGEAYSGKQHFNQSYVDIKEEKKDCEGLLSPLDEDYKRITFSFEVERNTELWLQPFVRQHNLEEDAYPADIYTYDHRVLPFERPKHKVSKVKFASATPVRKVILSRNRQKSKGRKLIIDDGRPRKSPRCHASTLAILSTVTNRRRSRDLSEKSKEDLDKTRHFLTDDENTRSSLMESVDLAGENENSEEILKNFHNEVGKLCVSNSLNDRYHSAISLIAKSFEPSVSSSNSNQALPKSVSRPLKKQKSKSIEDISSLIPLPLCMDVDPSILMQEDEIPVNFSLRPGPISDLSQLVSNSAYCCSMDRANLEQSHRTVDFLRNFGNFEGSCNSSDCGASSTCEMLGFMEDGRTVSRKRKRKRPNMTGWPLRNQKRKTLRQSESSYCCMDKSTKEEHSVVVESSFNDKEPLIFDANNCESLSEKSILDMEKKSKYLHHFRTQSIDSEDSSESCVNSLSTSVKSSKSPCSVRKLRSSSGPSHTSPSPKKQSVFKKHPKKRKKWSHGKKLR